MPHIARTSRLALACALLMGAALGCYESADSPTSPHDPAAPALATAAAAALSFQQVSAGEYYTCGVTTDHRAYCWGDNRLGQLGNGTSTGPETCSTRPIPCSTTPVAVAGGLSFRQISAGFFTTCGVTMGNLAYCWGTNELGEVGDGTTTERLTPTLVAGGHHFRQVETTFEHTCGVSFPDNLAYCWGRNTDGQLGTGTNTGPQTGPFGPYSDTPVAVARALPFRQVSTGYYHTCGVTTDNRSFCWGLNHFGQVGDSSKVFRRLMPSRVGRTLQWKQIDAGTYHTCAVTTDNRAFCWGNGRHGELGGGQAFLSFWPRAVAGRLSFTRVTASYSQTCGESLNRAYCWGGIFFSDGTSGTSLTPVAVPGGLNFNQVSTGFGHTCGRTPGAVAYCWGAGFFGQLGNGATASSPTPVAVAGPT